MTPVLVYKRRDILIVRPYSAWYNATDSSWLMHIGHYSIP